MAPEGLTAGYQIYFGRVEITPEIYPAGHRYDHEDRSVDARGVDTEISGGEGPRLIE